MKVVFGIVSWLPENSIQRQQRIERLDKTFEQLHGLFGDEANFIVIAQNWKDYKPPEYIKNIQIDKEPKLGILLARKTLRKVFLKSNYDYLIMCDDDIILDVGDDFRVNDFLDTLEKHPQGFMFLQYGWSLNFHAVSRYILENESFVDIDPEKEEGYEDVVWPWLLHYKYRDKEFNVQGIKFVQNKKEHHKNHKSTWMTSSINHNKLKILSDFYVERFKHGNFTINKDVKKEAKEYMKKKEWVDKALYNGWINKEDADNYLNPKKTDNSRRDIWN